MRRRNFLRRVVAAAAGLFGGAATVAAVDRVRDAHKEPPRRQRSQDLVLYRLDGERLARIDWFDQKPGDLVIAQWARGRVEQWEVTGDPFWDLTRFPDGPVEAVKMAGEWYLGEAAGPFFYDPETRRVRAIPTD